MVAMTAVVLVLLALASVLAVAHNIGDWFPHPPYAPGAAFWIGVPICIAIWIVVSVAVCSLRTW